MRWLAWLVGCTVLSVSLSVGAKDVEGSKDHPMLSRMPGYEIDDYDEQDFAAFEFAVDPPKKVEGRYWRIEYTVAEGKRKSGPLQIARNYTDPLVKRGGKKLREDVDAGGGTTVAHLASNGKSVWVQLDLANQGDLYTLVVVEEGAMEQKVEFSASELASALESNGSVALHGVLFDTGKATIQPGSAPTLEAVGGMLKADPALALAIEGHTDNVGTPAANLRLSAERAAAVRAYLVKQFGIAPARLSSAGFGDTKPVADNATEDGRAQNRRVELRKK